MIIEIVGDILNKSGPDVTYLKDMQNQYVWNKK